MFDSVQALDGNFVLDNDIDLFELKDAEFNDYFRPSKFCLLTNNGQKFGPYGTDSLKRKQVTKTIDRGDVLTHAFENSIPFSVPLSNDKLFNLNVSFFSMADLM